MPDGSIAWLDEALVSALALACVRDHGARLRLPDDPVAAALAAVPRRLGEVGERDPARLAAAYFVAVAGEASLGGGRVLLAMVVALVFLEINGREIRLREDRLARAARRFVRDGWSEPRIAAWFAEPGG